MNVTLICNPTAGRHRADGGLTPALDVLGRAGWSVTTVVSQAPGDGTQLARRAVAEGTETVLVAGGDGTLNEVVQGMAGSDAAMGYLPYGTVNVWAREVGIPLNPRDAARALVAGRRERIDLGIAGGRYFLLMAGIGFDSQILQRSRRFEAYKQRFGVLPYVAVGVTAAGFYRGVDLELRYDSVIRRVQALLLVVGNTRLYGGRFHLTPGAIANDGWLDVCIVKGRGPLGLARQSVPILITRSTRFSDVELLRVRHLAVQSSDPVAFQLDGELVGELPVQFQVVPRALEVIVPRAFSSDLIA